MVLCLALMTGQTAQGKSSRIILPHKHLTIRQTIAWQHRIIRHDLWVIHTASSHRSYVVKWHRKQLKWTQRELKESLAKLVPFEGLATSDWLCIHRYEGAWTSNTGNGYYGGLQMDLSFQASYGPEFLHRWGTADKWPVWAQIVAAERAKNSGRGYSPWPNTARYCGLL